MQRIVRHGCILAGCALWAGQAWGQGEAAPKLDTGDPQSPPPAAQEKIVPDDRFVLAELAPVGCGFACHGRPPGGFQRMNLLKTGNHAGAHPYLHSVLSIAQGCGKCCCMIVITTLGILGRSADVAFGIERVEAIQHHGPPSL